MCEFFVETFHETRQDVAGVADLFGVLSHDPYQCASGIRLIQIINALTERWYYTLVAGVLPEDILDHHDRFLDDIVHFRADEFEEGVDAFLACSLDLDCDLSDCFHRATDEVHVDFLGILLELGQKLVNVSFIGDSNHDFKLLEFQIWWIVVFAEENAHLFAENVRLLLQKEIDVSKCDVLYLWLRRD